jgi:hypothetical protein
LDEEYGALAFEHCCRGLAVDVRSVARFFFVVTLMAANVPRGEQAGSILLRICPASNGPDQTKVSHNCSKFCRKPGDVSAQQFALILALALHRSRVNSGPVNPGARRRR